MIPFVLWLLRYALLLDRGQGQAPEEVVLRDRFLLTMTGRLGRHLHRRGLHR